MQILCLADGDTRLKWAHHVAAALGQAGELRSVLVTGRSEPSSSQLADVGVTTDVERVELADVGSGVGLRTTDVVVVCTVGETCWRTISGAARLGARRPIVVTGYAGLVYEKHNEGLLWRTGADVICVNSPHDHNLFERTLSGLNLATDPLLLTGPGVLLGAPRRPPTDPTAIVFATQPSVPSRRSERVYVLERLTELAQRLPHQRVIVKLRTRPGQVTAHPEPHHYERLHRKVFGDAKPPNLEFAAGPMVDVLDHAAGLVTFSSTAAAEALARSIPTAILTDLGVREGLGNHAFVGSGCLTSFEQLLDHGMPKPNPDWLTDHGINEVDGAERLAGRVAALLEARDRGDLTQPEAFISPHRTPYLTRSGPTSTVDPPTSRAKRAVGVALDRYGRRAYERLAAWASRH